MDSSPLLSDPTKEVSDAYFKTVVDELCNFKGQCGSSKPVVFTPLHGEVR